MANAISSLFKLVFGLVLIVLPIYLVLAVDFFRSWGAAALIIIKGGILLFVIFLGLIFLLLGFSDLKG
ncbi:hypothetical protein HYX15_02240 [Candidatus Woesearchaeota archaeon]|nr:hypothetical protein [Candidatus Woesearchaeota archaeon]